ncbi:putative pentatricopeptide [Medicago truncatula]|uniref:Putative pentatricopeptide n=1 Tax=Medicago truncatula TaxID=3880 RepID=A0A396HS66_MEDTR|nr:putative pentatricopeptide [Medicago truncatula]
MFSIGVIELGIWVHSFIVRMRIVITVPLCTAIYLRCGSIDRSFRVFDEMPERNIVMWIALINGLAVHGRSGEALKVFDVMKESGLKPDGVLFIGVLVACSHGGGNAFETKLCYLEDFAWSIYES